MQTLVDADTTLYGTY